MRSGLDGGALALVIATSLVGAASLVAGAASAEDARVLRVVGVQPLDASAARAGGPRQGAVDEALYEAVSRVALELVDEYGAPTSGDADAGDGTGEDVGIPVPVEREEGWLKSALGSDMTPYARSFRIVEDQGSRPVLFPGESKATREYVVVVEATVDVDKVRDRLAAKGLIGVEEDLGLDGGIEVEALGLRHWSAYEALLALLEGPGVRASQVQPVEFEAGRAVVHVVVRGSPEDLVTRMLSSAPRGLEITDTAILDGSDEAPPRVRLQLLWSPPTASARR